MRVSPLLLLILFIVCVGLLLAVTLAKAAAVGDRREQDDARAGHDR